MYETIESAEELIAELEEQLYGANKELMDANVTIAELDEQLDSLSDELEEANLRIFELEDRVLSLDYIIGGLEDKLENSGQGLFETLKDYHAREHGGPWLMCTETVCELVERLEHEQA